MLLHKNLVFRPFSRLFNISAFWNAFQNYFKWVLKFILHSCQIWTLYNTFTVPEAHKYEQHKMRTMDTLWTYKYIFAFCYGIWFSHRNKATTDPRNWVHGKNQNRWNMNRCNLGCIKQSKKENKKANWLPMKQKWQRIWSCICYMIENTAHITA